MTGEEYLRMLPSTSVSFGCRREQTPRSWPSLSRVCFAAVLAVGLFHIASAETWRGLTIAPEHRCTPYDKKHDYPYRAWGVCRNHAHGIGC